MKNFLKISTGKIILSLIIFLLLPVWFKTMILGGPSECNGAMTCQIGTNVDWAPIGGIFFIASLFVGGNQLFENLNDYLIKLPYLIIISYTLSAGVIYLFKKRK